MKKGGEKINYVVIFTGYLIRGCISQIGTLHAKSQTYYEAKLKTKTKKQKQIPIRKLGTLGQYWK